MQVGSCAVDIVTDFSVAIQVQAIFDHGGVCFYLQAAVTAALGQHPEHALQLPAVTPRVCPCAIGNRVTNAVVTDGRPGVTGEQVAPVVIIIGVNDGIQCFAQAAGSIRILGAAQDIAGVFTLWLDMIQYSTTTTFFYLTFVFSRQ